MRLTKVLTPDMRLIGDWIVTLHAGRRFPRSVIYRIAPLTIRHVVGALIGLADTGSGGIWQISGASDIAYDGVAHYLAIRLGLPASLVRSITAAEKGISAEDVTAYTSLDCSRLRAATGFVPPEPEKVIDEVFGQRLRPANDLRGDISLSEGKLFIRRLSAHCHQCPASAPLRQFWRVEERRISGIVTIKEWR